MAGLHFSLFRGIALGAMTPVPDGLIPALGNQLQLSRRLQLIGAGARLTAITAQSQALIDIPSCNQLGPLAIAPLFLAADAPRTLDLSLFPTQLQVGDPVSVQQAETATYEVGLFFADELQPAPSGPIAWVPYTPGNTTGSSASAWQTVSLALTTRLPAGRYHVLAIRHYQPEIVAVRLLLAGSPLRPGAFAFPATALGGEDPSLPGPTTSGVMGSFDAIAPPMLEVFRPTGTGTGAAGTGMLLLQRAESAGCGGVGCNGGGDCAGGCKGGSGCRQRGG